MNTIKKIISISLMITMLCASFSYSAVDKKEYCINDMITVESKDSSEESEFFKANIKYPYLKFKEELISNNKKYYKNIEKINDTMSKYVIDFKNEVKNQSKEYGEEYKEKLSKLNKKYVKYQYEAYSDYKVEYNKNNMISIPITTYEFSGGAHGMTYLKAFNYDLATGKEIKLKDIFDGCSNYKDIINESIKLEIDKNNDLYFSGEEGFKGISNNQDFYINDDGIVVFFQLYDIAPYYVGIPKFKIPWSKFSNCSL
ncbi:MAG: DUF3298 and DUF4163 domain-containing protein [Peptostreptococcaceae bacterium]